MRIFLAMSVWIAALLASPPRAASAPDAGPTVRMRVTAYCPCSQCCGPRACGITASGQPVTANGGHFVAAGKSIPFHTMVIVPGYAASQPVPVLDRGGAIYRNRIDVFFPTHAQAQEWGVRWLPVIVKEPP